jgi:hypothetical protein
MAGEQGGAKPSGQPAAPLERRDQQNLTRWQFFSPAGPGEAYRLAKPRHGYLNTSPRARDEEEEDPEEEEQEKPYTPFPFNPSFKPPVPTADWLRSQIFADFMHNHTENNERALGARYNFSIKRIEAILRLKGMEKDWKKVSSSSISLLA